MGSVHTLVMAHETLVYLGFDVRGLWKFLTIKTAPTACARRMLQGPFTDKVR